MESSNGQSGVESLWNRLSGKAKREEKARADAEAQKEAERKIGKEFIERVNKKVDEQFTDLETDIAKRLNYQGNLTESIKAWQNGKPLDSELKAYETESLKRLTLEDTSDSSEKQNASLRNGQFYYIQASGDSYQRINDRYISLKYPDNLARTIGRVKYRKEFETADIFDKSKTIIEQDEEGRCVQMSSDTTLEMGDKGVRYTLDDMLLHVDATVNDQSGDRMKIQVDYAVPIGQEGQITTKPSFMVRVSAYGSQNNWYEVDRTSKTAKLVDRGNRADYQIQVDDQSIKIVGNEDEFILPLTVNAYDIFKPTSMSQKNTLS